jgi:2'-5' RNA ligase superfamily protein
VAARRGPILVTALFGEKDFAWLEGLRRTHYPADRNRVPVHLTLFSHLPPSIEHEATTRLAAVTAAPPPPARVAGLMDLGEGTALRVESVALAAIRRDLADAFHGMLAAQDGGPWSAHVTIQNKVEPREARQLQAQLAARFEPRPLAIKGLALWRYLDGPWDPIARYSFRR